MKTSQLSDALLDYWTSRAEGVPADYASTPSVAICRDVVRAAFGDDVEHLEGVL